MATFSAIYLQTMCLKSLQVIQVRETVWSNTGVSIISLHEAGDYD